MRFALKTGVVDSEDSVSQDKRNLLVAGLIIAAGLIFLITIIITKLGGNTNASSEYVGNIQTRWDACKLFSLDDAQRVLGKNAELSKNNANAVSSKATVSTCSYSSGSKKPEDLIALTVLIRSSNKIQARQAFEVAKPKDAVDMKNLGDQANYSNETNQLNVLKNENWIIIATTKGAGGKVPANIPKQTAEIIVNRL